MQQNVSQHSNETGTNSAMDGVHNRPAPKLYRRKPTAEMHLEKPREVVLKDVKGFSTEENTQLWEMSMEAGAHSQDILRKAFVFYQATHQARTAGSRVALVDEKGAVIVEGTIAFNNKVGSKVLLPLTK